MVPINYLAVFASVVVMVVLGSLWYGPLFGKTWARLAGISMDRKPSSGEMAKLVGIMAIGSFFMAFVLAHSLVFAASYTQSSGISAGLMAAFWNWLGFIVPLTVSPVLWEKKPWSLFFLNSAYYLVGLCLMGTILAIWV